MLLFVICGLRCCYVVICYLWPSLLLCCYLLLVWPSLLLCCYLPSSRGLRCCYVVICVLCLIVILLVLIVYFVGLFVLLINLLIYIFAELATFFVSLCCSSLRCLNYCSAYFVVCSMSLIVMFDVVIVVVVAVVAVAVAVAVAVVVAVTVVVVVYMIYGVVCCSLLLFGYIMCCFVAIVCVCRYDVLCLMLLCHVECVICAA